MSFNYGDVVEKFDQPDYLRGLIKQATATNVNDIKQTEIATEIVLAMTIGDKLQKALSAHADALVESARASERHTRSLKNATWALAIFTAVLAVATIALFIATILPH